MDEQKFRKELYESFSAKGLPEILKLHMRTSLVKGLRDGSFPRKSESPDDFGKHLTDRLVHRHLQRSGYNYTLSVFAPEAGLHGSEVAPGLDDILQLMNVMPGSVAYTQIKKLTESEEYAKCSDLWLIIKCLLGCFGADPDSSRKSTGMQTGSSAFDFSSSASTFSDKLRAIDEEFDQRERLNESSVSERLNAMRREIEQRYKVQLENEIQRVKQNEIARIRLDLEEKSRKEVAALKTQMECKYEERLMALQRREEASAESARSKMTSLEKEAYVQRQHALEQIEALRKREVAINRHADMQSRNLNLVEAKLKETEKALDAREVAVNQLEASYESKLYQAEMRAREQIKAEYASRLACVEREEISVQQQKTAIEQSAEKLKHLNEIELKMEEGRVEVESLRRQNEINQERLQEMTDYHKLKQENILLIQEVQTLKRSLDDVLTSSAKYPLNSERHLTSRAVSEQGPSLVGSSRPRVQQRGVPPISSHGPASSNRPNNIPLDVPALDVIDIDDETIAAARGSRQQHQNWNAMNAQTLSIMRQMSGELAQLKMQMALNQNQPMSQQQFPSSSLINPTISTAPNATATDLLADDIPDISTSSTDEDLLAGFRRTGGPVAGRSSAATIFRKEEESYQGLGFLTDSKTKMQTLAQEADHLETRYKTYSQRLSMLAQETYKIVTDPVKEYPNDQLSKFKPPNNIETFERGTSSSSAAYLDNFTIQPKPVPTVELNSDVTKLPPSSSNVNISKSIPVNPKLKPTSGDISLLNDSNRSLLSPINFAPSSALVGKEDEEQPSDGEDIVAGSFIKPRNRAEENSSTNQEEDASHRKSSNINRDLSEAFKFNLHKLSEDRSGLGQTIEEVPKPLEANTSYGVEPKREQHLDKNENFQSENFFHGAENILPTLRLQPLQQDKPESLAELLEEDEIEEEASNDEMNFEENDLVLDDYLADNIDPRGYNLAPSDDDLKDFGHLDDKDMPESSSNVRNEEPALDAAKKASFRNVFAYSQEFSDEDVNYAKTKDAKKQEDDFYDSDFELSLNTSNRQRSFGRNLGSPSDLFVDEAGDHFKRSLIETTTDVEGQGSKGQMETGGWQSKSNSDDSF